MSEDEVTDYLVMEAVALKANQEDADQAKKQEAKAFKSDTSSLEQFR